MTLVQETVLVAGREMRRNFKSAKGVVLLVLCVLGGIAVALAMAKLSQLPDMFISQSRGGPGGPRPPPAALNPEDTAVIQEQMLQMRYGKPMGSYLAKAPFMLFAATLTTVWLAPLLTALVGFDAISTDLQHRGIRYFTLRVRRTSYYFGKLFGLWAVVSVLMLISQAIIWTGAMIRGSATFAEVVSWGPRFWIVTVIIGAAWSGVAQFVASQFKVPILALLVTLAAFFGVWIVDVIGELALSLHPLVYAYPNTYDEWLMSPELGRIALGALVCFGFMAGASALGAFLFVRRDI